MLIDFRNYFTVTLQIQQLICYKVIGKIPTHFKCIAILLCVLFIDGGFLRHPVHFHVSQLSQFGETPKRIRKQVFKEF